MLKKFTALIILAGLLVSVNALNALAEDVMPEVAPISPEFLRWLESQEQKNSVKPILRDMNSDSDSELDSDSEAESQSQAQDITARLEKIDLVLDKYESGIKNFYSSSKDTDKGHSELNAILFRLKSKNTGVINTALRHSGHVANKPEFRRALCEVLKRPVIDSETAKLAGSLPFEPQTRKQLALDSAENAGNFPAGLILNLIGDDFAVMEKFLLFVSPENAPLIIRRIPAGKTLCYSVLRHLLSSDDEKLLVPLLSAMKLKFPKSASDHKKRLYDLELHSSPAVRAWARQLGG